MSSTTTRNQIGSEDINWYDGEDTFTRRNSTGGTLTLNKVKKGYEFDAYEILGDDSLVRALNIIGSDDRVLVLRPEGTWNIPNNTTIPANVTLKVLRGAVLAVANSRTLTINGFIEAGPYQIFSWNTSGAVDISGSPVVDCFFDWWGPSEGIGNTVTAELLKAYQSCGSQQNIIIRKGVWRLATTMTYAPAGGWVSPFEVWIPNLVGEDPIESIIYIDVGASNDGIAIGGIVAGDTHWIQSGKIKNINIVGPVNACRYALNLACWNGYGGTENVNLIIGSTDFAVRLAQQENSVHDFTIGWWNSWLETNSIPYGYMKDGVKYEPEPGGTNLGCGTWGLIRIRKSSSWGGTRALYGENCGNLIVEEGLIENCLYGEVDGWPFFDYVAPLKVKLYSGSITKVARVFTLTESTDIRNVGWCLDQVGDSLQGAVTATIYDTAASAPTGAATSTSHTSIPASTLNGGGPFNYVFEFLPVVTLAAGTYAVAVEYSDGDASHYVQVDVDNDTSDSPGCYTYDGSWHLQSYDARFGINVNPAMEFYNSSRVRIKPQHFEANWIDIKIDLCTEIDIANATVGGSIIEIARSHNIRLAGVSESRVLKIDPVSSVELEHMVFPTSVPGNEDYGNTLYAGRFRDWAENVPPNIMGNNPLNLMPNHLFDRWASASPDGWTDTGNTTWSLETSTVHQATNSAKLVLANADDQTTFTFPAEVLKILKGQHVIFSMWLYYPASQVWGGDAHKLQLVPTYPTWTNGTVYNIGDAIYEASNMFVCVIPGTSGTAPNEPTWASVSDTEYVDDNTVRWLRWEDYGGPLNGGVMDDAVSDALWHRWHVAGYVPRNATALELNFLVKLQSTPANTTVYLAEPMLNLGFIPGKSLMPAVNEADSYLQVGGNKIFFGTAPPAAAGVWYNQGDVCFRSDATTGQQAGWSCTVSGVAGAATWKAMGNLA